MKELIRFKANCYTARRDLVQALNELGYGTRVEEAPIRNTASSNYFVIAYEKKERIKT